MLETKRLNFGTWVKFVFIFSLYSHDVFSVEPSWLGRNKLSGEPTGIIRGLNSIDGRLFVGAENGFFEVTGTYSTQYTSQNSPLGIGYITKLHLDDGDNLWLSEYGNGVYRYNYKTAEFNQLVLPDLIAKHAWSVSSNDTVIVVAAIDRLAFIDKSTNEINVVDTVDDESKLTDVYSIDRHDNGFVVAERNSLLFFDDKGKLKNIVHRQISLAKLKRITFVKSNNETLYVGGVGGVYKVHAGEFIFFPIMDKQGSQMDVESILLDDAGNLWVAAGGLYQLNELKQQLVEPQFASPKYDFDQIRAVQDIHQLDNGDIIIASTQLGLTSINPADAAMNYVHESEFPFRKDIYSAASMGNNHYLVKTAETWRLFNGETGRLTHLSGGAFDIEPIPLASGDILDITSCSLYHYENHQLIITSTLNDPLAICPHSQPLNITLNNQTYFYYQHEGQAGFATISDNTIIDYTKAPIDVKLATRAGDNKMVLLDKHNVLFESEGDGVWIKHELEALKNVFVYCLYEGNHSEQIFFCTSGTGLKQYSLTDKTMREAFSSLGLPRFIRDGYFDGNGNHWLATNKGLIVANNRFKFAFDHTDGVIDTDFNYRGILPLHNNQLLLVGDQLSYVINTRAMANYIENRRSHRSHAKLVGLQYRTRRGNLIDLNNIDSSVSFNQRPDELTLAFASADFHYSNLQHVEYRLSGLHDEWNSLPANYGAVTYSGLPYGQFQFQIRSVDKKSTVEQPITHLTLNLTKPVWLSWQANSVYSLVGILLILWLCCQVKRYAEEKNRVLAEIIRQKESVLREMNDAMADMLARKNALFKHFAYELRTSVMLLMGPLLNLKNTTKNIEERAILDRLYQQTSRIRSIMDQVTALEHIQSIGKHEIVSYDIGKSVQYVMDSIRPKATAKRQVLTFDCKINYPLLLVEDSLEKMLYYLLDNAISLTQEGGFIKVAITESESQTHLSVTDNGTGLSHHELDLIHRRFDEDADQKHQHILVKSLNLVNELVLANFGWLEIQSEKGVGTTFSIHLPTKRAENSTESEQTYALVSEVQNGNQMSHHITKVKEVNTEYQPEGNTLPLVLIVDDNQLAADYIVSMLSERFTCYDVRNAKQALAVLTVLQPDLVLTDLKMPGIDGIALTKKIRALDVCSDVPIIMLTAVTDKELEKQSFKATVNDYLYKPVEREELVLRIESQLAISAMAHDIVATPKPYIDDIQSNYVKSVIPDSPSEKERSFIVKLVTIIENNYKNETFSRGDAAAELAMSERQLNRMMAKLMPDNFTQFLKRYRLDKSLTMLANGMQITQVALDVGFGSPSYFSRCFKIEFGCLPTQITFTEQHHVHAKERQTVIHKK